MWWRRRLQPGDLIIWTDGTPAILLKRFDMYAKPDGSTDHYPSYCWHVAFSGPTPQDYNEKYGILEVNMKNLGMVRRGQGDATR